MSSAAEYRRVVVDNLIQANVDRDRAERIADIAMHSADQAYESLCLNLRRLDHEGEQIIATRLACEILRFRSDLNINALEEFVQ